MTDREREAYRQGFLDGIECFAWMKDGVMYVGTTGTTLEQADKMFEEGKLWNQLKPTEDLKLPPKKNSSLHFTTYIRPVHRLASFKINDKGGFKKLTHMTICGAEAVSDLPNWKYNWSRHWRHVDCPKCLEHRTPRAYKFWREEKREKLSIG